MHEEEVHTVLWSSDPRAFLDVFITSVPASTQSRVADMRAFVEALRRLTAIPFDGGQFWRIGCFEIVERVQQDRAQSSGLYVKFVNDGTNFRLRVVITGPLAVAATDVRIRAAGGNGPDMALVFLDKLFSFRGADILVDLPERGVIFDVEVFGGAERVRLRSHRVTRLQNLTITSRLVSDDEETWLPLLPPELREQATSGMSSLMTTSSGDAGVDAWTTAQATAAAYENAFFPARARGFVMVHERDTQRAAVRAILESAGSGMVIIADPYFDKTALEAHLIGRRNMQASFRIVTSLNDDTKQYSERNATVPQFSGGGEPQIEEPIDDESGISARPKVSLGDLLDRARVHHNDLPLRMEIVNIQNRETGKGEQFHDRFIHVQGQHGRSTLWWFGNSLNSIGRRRFPLFLTEVQGSQRLEYAEYVRLLGEGKITQRPDATAVVHWKNQASYTSRQPIAQGVPELTRFPGWERIVEILGHLATVAVDLSSADGIVSTVNSLAAAEYLQVHAGEVTWHLPEDRHAVVSATVAEALKTGAAGGEVLPLVEALAHWAGHLGLPGDAVSLAPDTMVAVFTSVGRWLDDEVVARPDRWTRSAKPIELAIDEALDRVANMRYSDEGRHPILIFVRDAGLYNDPAAYWRFVSSRALGAVYESVTSSTWPLDDGINATALPLGDVTLVAQIVAVHLENQQPERAALTVRGATLSDTDRAIALSRLLVEDRRPVDETRPPFLLEWRTISLGDDVAERLAAMLDRHHSSAAVNLLRALADEHPEYPAIRQRLIERWTRYLAPRPSATELLELVDGYPRSEAKEATMAAIAAEQYASAPDASRRFLDEVIRPLDLTALNAPFAREASFDAWRDAAHRAIRVAFAGANIILRTGDNTVLAQPIARIVTQLNRQSWGDITYDLLPINGIFGLARAAVSLPPLDDALAALIRTQDVPAALRLTAIIAIANGLERFTVESSEIDVEAALRHFNPNQRQAIVDALVNHLENVTPDSGILSRLRAAHARMNSDAR